MKKTITLFLILLSFYINAQDNSTDKSQLIKRTLIILPFENLNKIEGYDYLSNIIRDTLKVELENNNKFIFLSNSKFDDTLRLFLDSKGKLKNKNSVLKDAIGLGADTFIYGSYSIDGERININTNCIDILSGDILLEINKEGSVGIELLSLIDESSNEIGSIVSEKLTLVQKNYYEKKLKEQKNKIERAFSKEKYNDAGKVLDLEGQVLLLRQREINLEKKVSQNTLESIFKSSVDTSKCKIIDKKTVNEYLTKNNIDADNVIDKERALTIAKELNADYLVFGIAKKRNKRKTGESLLLNTEIIDVNKKRSILIRKKELEKSDIYNPEDDFVELFDKNDENIDEVSYFKRGFDFTIGGGLYLLNYEGKMANHLLLNNNSVSGQVGLLHFRWGIFIPISLSYYLFPKYAFGFTFKTGYAAGYIFHPAPNDPLINLFLNSIIFNLFLKNKFGEVNNKFKFLLDIGAEINVEITDKPLIHNFKDKKSFIGDLFFGAGPEIFTGFEYSKNKFSLEAGCFIGVTFGGQSFINYTLDQRGYNLSPTMGFELRFNYIVFKNYYYKKVKVNFINEKKYDTDKKPEINNNYTTKNNKKESEKVLDLEGQVLLLTQKEINIGKNVSQNALESIFKSSMDTSKCMIIDQNTVNEYFAKNNIDTDNVIDKERALTIAKELNADYLVLDTAKKRNNKKNGENVLLNTEIIDVNKKRSILIKKKELEKSETYNPESDLVELFDKNDEKINEVSYFKRGSEITIGGGV